jgi:hypothetical protein
MEQHPHTFLGWLNHHWAFISLVCFPAFMGYLNGLAAFFRVMGNTKLSDWLSKFEEALKAFIANSKPQNQTTDTTTKGS